MFLSSCGVAANSSVTERKRRVCDGVCRRGRAKHPTSKQSSRNTRGGNLVDPFQQRTSARAHSLTEECVMEMKRAERT